ncbi:MAG: uracil phosphoribosyltransferase, partial [Cypionkella sp.]
MNDVSRPNVTVIDHPLIQHKLTIMRDKQTSIAGFRRLLREIAHLMCYEVTRDLELEMIPIETPMALMDSPSIKGKKLVFASILRAGNGLLDGMLDL